MTRRAAPPKSAELQRMASDAFDAHVALMCTEAHKPYLMGNPYWQALRDTAFARFRSLYEHESGT